MQKCLSCKQWKKERFMLIYLCPVFNRFSGNEVPAIASLRAQRPRSQKYPGGEWDTGENCRLWPHQDCSFWQRVLQGHTAWREPHLLVLYHGFSCIVSGYGYYSKRWSSTLCVHTRFLNLYNNFTLKTRYKVTLRSPGTLPNLSVSPSFPTSRTFGVLQSSFTSSFPTVTWTPTQNE